MKTYLVGGAVRDQLMGLPVSDRDYVVVGSSVEEMLSFGFKQVGADFPVFLHPETGEEYALARKEKKVGNGYNGFETSIDKVTLEEDLFRRDVSINAMAVNLVTGEIIDPFGGQEDIKNGILRHTSEAFAEDPVRALRLARLAARYDFTSHYETILLVRQMIDNGELNFLTSERVFKEFEKATKDNNISRFIEELFLLGVLTVIFPEINELRKVWAGPERYHGEGSAFKHTLMVIEEAKKYNNPLVTFGAMFHDVGKILSIDKDYYIDNRSHLGHEEAGVSIVENFCNRLKMPSEYKRIGVLCARHHGHVHKTFEMNAKSFVKIYKDFNKGHFEHDLDILIKVSEADHFGRISIDNAREDGYPEGEVFRKILTAIHNYKVSHDFPIEDLKKMDGDLIQQKTHQGRCRVAKNTLKELKNI